MKRFLANAVLLAVAGLASGAFVRAQDTIRYLDRKTMIEAAPASGTIIEESPAHVVYKSAGAGIKEIAALDVIDITYEIPASVRLMYRSALSDERKMAEASAKEEDRKKAFHDALKSYREVLSRLAGEKNRFAERHVQYEIARLQAWRAEDNPSHRESAMVALTKFKRDHADSWQISRCARLIAQLQLDKGDTEGARKTYEELAATANIPGEVRQDCEFRIVETLILAKRFAEAEGKLQALLKSAPANDPLVARVSVYQAECLGASGKLPEAVAQLEGIIARTTDRDLKALAYNALGDCYRLNSQPREALWPYLWVDVIYHQGRQEHAKAMAALAKLFEELGDAARAKEYKDKLKRILDS